MKTIGVSGGKGGTGKTFVAVNLAVGLSRDYKVLLIDADVDNPNCSILLGESLDEPVKMVTCFFPKIDEEKCIKCGKCSRICRFHALFYIEEKVPMLVEPLCKSCTLCQRICPSKAIEADEKEIGELFFKKGGNMDLLVGRLRTGSAKSTPLIMQMMEYANDELISKKDYDFVIVDTSPGAHCDVEHALSEVERVICVTEPTPLGKHDLDRILQLCKIVGKDADIIINRSDMADYKGGIEEISEKFGSKIISRIPLSRDVMETYARGIPIMSKMETYGENHEVIKEFIHVIGGITG
ncbi:MAG: P-loop NTPase [Candidatus Hodarchaeota archaeon]